MDTAVANEAVKRGDYLAVVGKKTIKIGGYATAEHGVIDISQDVRPTIYKVDLVEIYDPEKHTEEPAFRAFEDASKGDEFRIVPYLP